jgi:hypothetical protein
MRCACGPQRGCGVRDWGLGGLGTGVPRRGSEGPEGVSAVYGRVEDVLKRYVLGPPEGGEPTGFLEMVSRERRGLATRRGARCGLAPEELLALSDVSPDVHPCRFNRRVEVGEGAEAA